MNTIRRSICLENPLYGGNSYVLCVPDSELNVPSIEYDKMSYYILQSSSYVQCTTS